MCLLLYFWCICFFFFKQKTAYEMRISDWSSDVCSSDLYVIALGYAGWGQGQLEEEMTRHGWFVAPVSDQLLFGTSAQDRWSAAWSANGIDSSLLASKSGQA